MSAAAELRKDARLVAQLPGELTLVAAKRYQEALGARVGRDAGSDARLSGMRSGSALTAETFSRTTRAGASTTVFAGPKSMRRGWSWLQSGTRARRQGRGRHPGTKPKHTFTAAVSDATPSVLQVIDKHFTNTRIGD